MQLCVQLYTVRDQLAADLRGTLLQIREMGYRYIEGGSVAAQGAEAWKQMLDELGLQMSGMHIGLETLESDLESAIEDALQVRSPYLIVPYLAADRRGDYVALGKQLGELGRRVSERGLQLAYHNHDFELLDGGLDDLYAHSDPEALKAEIDVAWVQIGRQDPIEWIRKLGRRARLVHLKDYDPAKDPVWQPGGQGVVDWDGVLAACDTADVEFGAVELDLYAGDPLDALRMSYEFFSRRGLS